MNNIRQMTVKKNSLDCVTQSKIRLDVVLTYTCICVYIHIYMYIYVCARVYSSTTLETLWNK